jgi:hypothetical protein
MEKTGKKEMGRLAMREEGEWWVAYFAAKYTMDKAIELGRLHMRLASIPERKATFLGLMRDGVSDVMMDVYGNRPEWGGAHSAPEHERAGRA